MRRIEIEDETWEGLQKLGVTFVDTENDVIKRLLSFYNKHHSATINNVKLLEIDATNCNGVSNSRILHATIGNTLLTRNQLDGSEDWSVILRFCIKQAIVVKGLDGFLTFRDSCGSPWGRRIDTKGTEKKGWKQYKELGLWIQGMTAADCAEGILDICNEVRYRVEIYFHWPDEPYKAGRLVL